MKLNKKLIEEAKSKDLVCIENDGSVEQLDKVIMLLFPKEEYPPSEWFDSNVKYFYSDNEDRDRYDYSDVITSQFYTHYKVTDFYEPEIKQGDLVCCKDFDQDDWEDKGEYLCPDTKRDGHWVILGENTAFYYDEVKPYKEEAPEYTIEELIEKLGHEFKIKKQ